MRVWPFHRSRPHSSAVEANPRGPARPQIRILSLSGGGIRGLLTARLLEHLMDRVGTSVADTFHLVAGNSTGALIAMTQVRPDPHPVSAVPGFYHTYGPKIFTRTRRWGLRTNWGLGGPKYPLDGLRASARAMAGQAWLSQTLIDFMAPAYDLVSGQPYWFQSWTAQGGDDFALADVGQASASAPTFFPASRLKARDRGERIFSDGGLFANNPALKAVQVARDRYGKDLEVVLVSLGTGQVQPPRPAQRAENWGLISWISPLIDILHSMNEVQMQENLARVMAEHQAFHLDLDVTSRRAGIKMPSTAIDLASPTNLKRLDALAEIWIEEAAPILDALVPLLSAAKADLKPLDQSA